MLATVRPRQTVQSAEAEPSVPEPDVAHAVRMDWRHPSLNAVMALCFVLVGLRIGLAPLHDNSFMTHLATGRIILDHGSIPRVDPYSFTAHGRPWTVQSWGASVIYAGLERLAGLAGIRAFVGLCCAALAVLAWHLTRPAGSLVARLLPGVLLLGIGANLWAERPLLLGLLCLGAVILAGEGDLDPRWLVPVMWFWVNVHGSFPLGLVALGVVAVGRWFDHERPEVELRALAWAVAGTVLGAVNPLGFRLLVFPLELLQHREAFAQIQEWQPPHWHTPAEWFFAVQLGLAVVLCLLRGRRWRVALPVLVFGAASLLSVRNVAQASFIMLPGMAACLAGLGSIDGRRRPAIARPMAAVLLVAGVLLTTIGLAGQPNTDLSNYPEASVTWMRGHGLLDRADRVVSRDFVGNYLEARYGPDNVQVYLDDRVDMFPIEVIRDYTQLIHPSGQYQQVLSRAKASAVLWDRDSPLGRWIVRQGQGAHPTWRIVHRADDWLVAVPVS